MWYCQRECSPMPVTHESFCSPRPSASASPYTVYNRCSFSNLLSIRDALNCTETGRLTGCPARVVSPSCPIFPPPHLTFIGFCAVLDRTRRHVSQFRHGDDQIPSGGSFRAVPQQHSIFDLRVARGVRYRKGRSVASLAPVIHSRC